MFTAVLPLVLTIFFTIFSQSVVATTEGTIKTVNPNHHAVIVQYHHVSEATPPSTSISPEGFAEHLQLIDDLGFQVLPLIDVIEGLHSGIGFKQKTLAITFDDSYDSIYTTAFPLLKARNLPFTIFVNPLAIDEQHGSTMTWENLIEMQTQGATIANHSQEHLHLLKKIDNETQLDWKQRIQGDILTAQNRLVEKLGIKNRYFAYPYGEFDEALKQLLSELNFISFSQQSGPINISNDFQSLPRFPASGIYANPATLKVKLNSLPFQIINVEPKPIIRSELESAPQLILTVKPNNIHYQQAQCFYQGEAIDTTAQLVEDTLVIQAQFNGPLALGRSRYNCTAPSKTSREYYWYSIPFITIGENNTWVD
ncbi:polysaccharide deacetylase family protein [Oceaniserpentilla sp. 4NH20-0058]|uniref:polysaccharide deacetylase family protein n=1 Tax=Oceaniserpentilla sp. 4NH20-0058 TaxID=3127660 RepID=UPI003101EE8D